MSGTHKATCLYECPDHHGPISARVHNADCVLPPTDTTPVCADCRAKIQRAEISADPYFRGDDYAMYGDGE